MLSKKHRATTAQVAKAISKGVVRHSANFTVRSVSNECPTTAVVVSKKVAPTAVERNTLKRRVRMIARTLNFPKNTTFVIYLKKRMKDLKISEIQKELQLLIT